MNVPVANLNSNSVFLGKKEAVVTSEEQGSISNLKKMGAGFDIPLSIFHYKDYNSDFFTSWYNVSSRIFKEINQACPEKQALNLALSVLMFPYIVFTALGLVIYNKFKTNNKTQISSEENKTKKSEVSESTTKRLAYGVLAAVAILVSIPILLLLLIPATTALATFYLLNRKLSHSLIAALKISSGSCENENQNIEVSFREIDACESDIKWDMEVKFPPQFEQLLKDLYENKNDSWFDVTQDSEHNTILKLSANIHLKNGLVPLRNEIRSVLATSIQEFAETMEKLRKEDITYDKLKELLDEFRLKVVDSIGPKLTSHLIQDAYRIAFIQAIKIAQERREKDFPEGFPLEERLKGVLVKQELESQGKELPTEKEMIIKDLKTLGIEVANDLSDDLFLALKSEWEWHINKGDLSKKTIIDIYKGNHPEETKKAIFNAEKLIAKLKGAGEQRYKNIEEKLKTIHPEIHKAWQNGNSISGNLRRKMEDLFKLELTDQCIQQELIKSRIKKANIVLNQSDMPINIKQSLLDEFCHLEKKVHVCSCNEVNSLLERMYLAKTKHEVQSLFEQQKKKLLKNIEDSACLLNKKVDDSQDKGFTLLSKRLEDISNLEKVIKECLEQKEYKLLKEKIEEQSKDIKKSIKDDKNLLGCLNKCLIDIRLESNEEIIKLLEQLELRRKKLLINEEAKNNYKEELASREKIKFAIIEGKLLDKLKDQTFNDEAIKELLEKAELEYCLAEKCIKYPVIKIKDNIKHFCQALLSPLIGNLVENIINNVPKDNKSGFSRTWDSCKVGLGYIKMGCSATKKNESIEGKALDVAHDTHKEGETFLQHFESSYEEVGALLGDVFSDDGETFKNHVWPKIKDHLYGMWDRFFKDIEFTLVGKDKNISQETEGTVKTKLDGLQYRNTRQQQ